MLLSSSNLTEGGTPLTKTVTASQCWAKSGIKTFGRDIAICSKKRGHKFSKDRSEWSVHRNFVQIYDEVYDAMVKAGVAEKLVEPMWVDETQQLTNKENAFG